MNTVEEARHLCIPGLNAKLKFYCRVFKDNAGAIGNASISK
jgi:hypothetical protein